MPTRRLFLNSLVTMIGMLSLFMISASGFPRVEIEGPEGSVNFGKGLFPLPNGNIVVADRDYSPAGSAVSIGAVYLINSATGETINTLIGFRAGDDVGDKVIVLPNGNYVVASRQWNSASAENVGAVTFCNGNSGCSGVVDSSNSLIGSTEDDRVGNQIFVLPTGNFLVSSGTWDNGAATDAGAMTFCSGITGCATGPVSSANSLVGTSLQQQMGQDNPVILSDGDYVIRSNWSDGVLTSLGAATWCSGTSGCIGVVSSANSLVGSQPVDAVGSAGITPLANGRYVVHSTLWANDTVDNAGAATVCDNTDGCFGAVTTSNSLHGVASGDNAGSSAVQLSNGNLVIRSQNIDINGVNGAGAVTFCDDLSACTGPVNDTNSLYGASTFDSIGTKIFALSNGNYVVQSPFWKFVAAENAGASTFCSGTTGCVGPVTSTNSFHGQMTDDRVATGTIVLPNGNYVILSESLDIFAVNGGAATFCNGTTGCPAELPNASNSLIGTNANDMVGQFQNKILPDGDFVIPSTFWGTGDEGAATFCSGTTGCPTGAISSSNSLVGSNASDRVGKSIMPLNNGNYAVLSPEWDRPASSNGSETAGVSVANAGAVTFCTGTTGCTGLVTVANSLVGSSANDRVGDKGRQLEENYTVNSESYDAPGISDAGAVVWCDADTGCIGEVSAANALIGTTPGDTIGDQLNIDLPNGDYVVHSQAFTPLPPLTEGKNNGRSLGNDPISNGAITFGNGATGTFGDIDTGNSIVGVSPTGGSDLNWVFNPVGDQLIVGAPADNKVTLLRKFAQSAPYDFDGDGRTDASFFRPSNGTWQLLGSSAGYFVGNLGSDGDVPTAADYDGDGITDIAIWRTGAGGIARIYILRSSDGTGYQILFGQTGDNPAVVGDWDGDGLDDPAVYRESDNTFYYIGSDNNPSNGITYLPFGQAGDKPVKGDFDGDGISDAAIFRPSTREWWIQKSSNPSDVTTTQFGLADDTLIPGDYDGDGKTDIAIFRAPFWYVLNSLNGSVTSVPWGAASDELVPGDYDGDGRIDHSIYRPTDLIWYIRQSSDSLTDYKYFGSANDIPIPGSSVTN